MDLSKRHNQVYGESVEGTLPPTKDYISTLMAVQEHHAQKAGRHFDIRFAINDKAVSFVTRHGLPKLPGEIRRLIRVPNHKVDYMTWEGEIPKGNYGAGQVLLHDKQNVVLKSEPERLLLDVHKGPNAGNYSIFKHNNDWFVVRKKELQRAFVEKEKFRTAQTPKDIKNVQNYIPLHKLDGAAFIGVVNPGGISLTSAQKSVAGELIPREHNVPHIRDTRVPELKGTVLKGELWHPLGFNTLSGILNSHPSNAVQTQYDMGKAFFAPYDIVKMPDGRDGKDVPFHEKIRVLQDIVKKLKNKYITLPGFAIKNKDEFEKKLLGNTEYEGIVYRHATDTKAPTYKVKNWHDYDLRVKRVIGGAGRLSDSVGALQLEDAAGRIVGNVGSGLSDMLRKKFSNDPQAIIGKIVKVKSMKPLIDKLRAPVFMGLSDKTTADKL